MRLSNTWLVLIIAASMAVPVSAYAQITPEMIARRIMDVCVQDRFSQGIARDKVAPQCRCAASAATKTLGRGDLSARPAAGAKLTAKQRSALDAAIPGCLNAGDDEDAQ